MCITMAKVDTVDKRTGLSRKCRDSNSFYYNELDGFYTIKSPYYHYYYIYK
jgi:hypothetical protein